MLPTTLAYRLAQRNADEINVTSEEVVSLLVQLILDEKIAARIDGIEDCEEYCCCTHVVRAKLVTLSLC
eukprot:g2409.t1